MSCKEFEEAELVWSGKKEASGRSGSCLQLFEGWLKG